ncbi:chaperonin-like RBCX protein 1, chloroplastic isoform X2 [Andrographis paniculata]|uniref:chaperonin-like RBCX protein 1, chloroplastic isoform X2 n=1 Tax=Andrographis paniculata TaxID=175694 RepID=UPI0021E79F7A|nr:chaperonin-like RBCX protein 1, chloroplastic isoform X2 [Andrographis paniculata]
MESSTVFSAPQFPFSLPKSPGANRSLVFSSRKSTAPLQCHKMYVPGFGEASPESKAAKHLHDFFTYVAVKIVNAQLQSYNPEAHADLMQFLEKHSLSDGDRFCAELMRESSRHKSLALRILEVRSAYCKNDFEWDNLKRLSTKMVEERNIRLMRDYVSETSTT